jgi:hypothetical protein
MKNFKSSILLLSAAILIISCKYSKDPQIAGVYVTDFKNEYSITTDTLILSSTNGNKTFQIERRSGYNKIREGKILPKEYKQAKWVADYNEDKQLLQETELGRQIHLSLQKHTLLLGDSQYQKIK